MLFLGFLLRHDDLLVEIFRGKDIVDMVRSEVVPKKLIIDGRTHQNYPHLRMLPNHSLDSQQNEVSIDVSLMHLIQDDKGVFVEKLSAVHQPLQEDSVRYEDDTIFRVD